MALRVYPRLHPIVNLGAKEAPGLAETLPQGIGGDDSISGHLLNGSMVDAKDPSNLGVIHEILHGAGIPMALVSLIITTLAFSSNQARWAWAAPRSDSGAAVAESL